MLDSRDHGELAGELRAERGPGVVHRRGAKVVAGDAALEREPGPAPHRAEFRSLHLEAEFRGLGRRGGREVGAEGEGTRRAVHRDAGTERDARQAVGDVEGGAARPAVLLALRRLEVHAGEPERRARAEAEVEVGRSLEHPVAPNAEAAHAEGGADLSRLPDAMRRGDAGAEGPRGPDDGISVRGAPAIGVEGPALGEPQHRLGGDVLAGDGEGTAPAWRVKRLQAPPAAGPFPLGVDGDPEPTLGPRATVGEGEPDHRAWRDGVARTDADRREGPIDAEAGGAELESRGRGLHAKRAIAGALPGHRPLQGPVSGIPHGADGDRAKSVDCERRAFAAEAAAGELREAEPDAPDLHRTVLAREADARAAERGAHRRATPHNPGIAEVDGTAQSPVDEEAGRDRATELERGQLLSGAGARADHCQAAREAEGVGGGSLAARAGHLDKALRLDDAGRADGADDDGGAPRLHRGRDAERDTYRHRGAGIKDEPRHAAHGGPPRRRGVHVEGDGVCGVATVSEREEELDVLARGSHPQRDRGVQLERALGGDRQLNRDRPGGAPLTEHDASDLASAGIQLAAELEGDEKRGTLVGGEHPARRADHAHPHFRLHRVGPGTVQVARHRDAEEPHRTRAPILRDEQDRGQNGEEQGAQTRHVHWF